MRPCSGLPPFIRSSLEGVASDELMYDTSRRLQFHPFMIDSMPGFRTLRTLALGLGLAILAGRADGQTTTPPEVRILDFANSGSTSTCIGNPVTPLCAVETFMACGIRSEWPLCARVGNEPGELRTRIKAGYAKLWYYRYKVLGERIIRAEDIPDWARRPGLKAWKPGDVAVRLWWEGCPPIEKCVVETQGHPTRHYGEGCRSFDLCGRTPSPSTYIVRPVGRKWRWVDDEDEDERPDFYGVFWKRK